MPGWIVTLSQLLPLAQQLPGLITGLASAIAAVFGKTKEVEQSDLLGPEKKEAVVNGAMGVLEAADAFAADHTIVGRLNAEGMKETTRTLLGAVNDFVVKLYNVVGIFTHKREAPAASPGTTAESGGWKG